MIHSSIRSVSEQTLVQERTGWKIYLGFVKIHLLLKICHVFFSAVSNPFLLVDAAVSLESWSVFQFLRGLLHTHCGYDHSRNCLRNWLVQL
jgi:hypothetical protein